MYTHLLLATDGSTLSDQAATAAVKLAGALGARLTAISVKSRLGIATYPAFPYPSPLDLHSEIFNKAESEHIAEALAKVQKIAGDAGLAITTASPEAAEPWRGIVDHAADIGADLIVMASNGRRGLDALLLGSEAQKVLTHSKVPVLIIR